MLTTRHAVRLAARLQAARAAAGKPRPGSPAEWDGLIERLAEARRVRDRLALADARGLAVAAGQLAVDLGLELLDLARLLDRIRAGLANPSVPSPTLRDWLDELRQLGDEFDDLTVRWPDRVLRAVTDPVDLDGVDLGRFAIEYRWDAPPGERGARDFDVIALDPNPPAGRPEVTHPHVRDNTLCGGDATGPIRRALEDGRLAEAFLLVRSVLTTYNPGSPYVALDDWEGTPCTDCGRRADTDDRYVCEGCDADVCNDCSGCCDACASTRCGGCLERCAVCRSNVCRNCVETDGDPAVCRDCYAPCPKCGERAAKDDRDAEGVCSHCQPPGEEVPCEDEVAAAAAAG